MKFPQLRQKICLIATLSVTDLEIRAEEARRIVKYGFEPVRKKLR